MTNPEIADLAARAQACIDKGNIVEARTLFSELCGIAPDNAEAWLMAGALHGETGAHEKALSCLNTAIQIKPDYPEAHLTLAHLYKASGALDAAYANARRALECDAAYTDARVFLGAVCCDLNRFEEAEQVSRDAVQQRPDNIQALISLATALCNLGRVNEAEPLVRTAMSLEGGNQPMVSALLGRILLSKGEFDQAEQLIQAALAGTPDDVTLLLNLANIRRGQGRLEEALAQFRSAMKLCPIHGRSLGRPGSYTACRAHPWVNPDWKRPKKLIAKRFPWMTGYCHRS